FIAVAIVTALPVFFASGYVLNPEAPLAPLWALGLVTIERMREHDEPWRPLLAGAVAGLAFLAKYSGVLLMVVALLYVVVSPRGRRWLHRPSFWLGGPVALLVALPVLIWNQQRGWPSLVLHFQERTGPTDLPALALHTVQVVLARLAPFHPSTPPGLLVVRVCGIRRSGTDDRYRFLALASWPVLLFFLVMMARVRDPESHWTMVGYLPLAVGAGGWLDERRIGLALRTYLAACLAVSVMGAAAFYAYARAPALRRFLPAWAYDANRDAFNEMAGWAELRTQVNRSADALGPQTVVASCQYALCAHILAALADRPPVYCPTERRTEFDFLARRDPPAGAPVLYIHDDHYQDDPATRLPDRACQPLTTLKVERGGVVMQNYHLWACPPAGRVE